MPAQVAARASSAAISSRVIGASGRNRPAWSPVTMPAACAARTAEAYQAPAGTSANAGTSGSSGASGSRSSRAVIAVNSARVTVRSGSNRPSAASVPVTTSRAVSAAIARCAQWLSGTSA